MLLSYPKRIQEWPVAAFMTAGIVGFMILLIAFFEKDRVELYVTIGILSLAVIGIILMMQEI